MKDRADKLLLTGAVLSLVIYLLNLWELRIPLPRWLYWLSVFQMLLAAGFHGVPAFCIQRFLLRTPGRRPLAALPPLLLLGWLLYCFLGLMSSRDNWEPILWFLRMFGTIAPAAGCALAWTARKTRRGGRKGGYLS